MVVFRILLSIVIESAAVAQTAPPLTPTPSLTIAPVPTPAQTVRLEGVLFERGTKKPLVGVNIFALPSKLKATTGVKGEFTIEGVPVGDVEIVVNSPGYDRLRELYEIEPGSLPALTLYLSRTSYHGLEATVVGKVAKRDDTKKTLRAEQFLTMPGSGGDPVKAVQNLPGVARVNGFSSQIVIQGSAPQDTIYHLDEHQVPLVFHFGGLTSVITPEAVDSVDYFSAGYGPEYGRAMGGIVGLRVRDPKTDRHQGFAFMDTMKAGALVEGPLSDKSSYLVTGRYSYLGVLLGAALKDRSNFDLVVAPAFADLAGVYKLRANEKDDVRIVSIFSRDELRFLLKEPVREDPSVRGNFGNTTTFYRILPQWTRRFDADHAARLSFGLGQDMIRVDVGSDFFDLNQYVVSNRAEYETKLAVPWKAYFGLDNEFTSSKVSLRLPQITNGGGVPNPISTGQLVETEVQNDDIVIAPYWRNVIRVQDSKWTWMPSLRTDFFSRTKETRPQPRLALRYDQDESLQYKAATGIYYQQPQGQETDPAYGNPNVKSPYAIHYMIGAEKDFRRGSSEGFTVNSGLFYRTFENLVVASSKTIVRDGALVAEKYSNDGRGRSYGAEFLIKYEKNPWSGWISYTLSKSLRTEPGQDEYVSRYDQTHNINLVGAVDLPRNWKISSRFRYVTGNPLTPINGGTFDSDNDVYVPTRGPFYSQRNEPFMQLDARFDKKWIYETWILWGYLDIQNFTNRQNPEGIRYSYDYSQKRTVTGLPMIPTLGVKGEF